MSQVAKWRVLVVMGVAAMANAACGSHDSGATSQDGNQENQAGILDLSGEDGKISYCFQYDFPGTICALGYATEYQELRTKLENGTPAEILQDSCLETWWEEANGTYPLSTCGTSKTAEITARQQRIPSHLVAALTATCMC